eukprot:COSAG02_NODE_1759_length_11042_cov_3.648725_11_plen_103_part_00
MLLDPTELIAKSSIKQGDARVPTAVAHARPAPERGAPRGGATRAGELRRQIASNVAIALQYSWLRHVHSTFKIHGHISCHIFVQFVASWALRCIGMGAAYMY